MNLDEVRAQVDATARDLLIGEPYYGHLLVGMIRVVRRSAAGVHLVPAGPAPGLAVDADTWTALSPAARMATLRHELLHLTLKHPLRARAFASLDLWGLACDLVVNQLCDTRELPGAIHPHDVGVEPGHTADTYYALLRDAYTRACHPTAGHATKACAVLGGAATDQAVEGGATTACVMAGRAAVGCAAGGHAAAGCVAPGRAAAGCACGSCVATACAASGGAATDHAAEGRATTQRVASACVMAGQAATRCAAQVHAVIGCAAHARPATAGPTTAACPDSAGGAGRPDPVAAAIRHWLDGPGHARHASWREFAALPSSTLAAFTYGVDALLRATVRRIGPRGRGTLPGGLLEIVDAIVRPPEVPWRRVLRMFGATAERTRLRSTVTRPSKRYGTTPGVRVRRSTELVVAVDTSGSVDERSLTAFFAEIHALWRRGVAVTVLEADTVVQREYPYRGRPPGQVAGRGGTGFDAAIVRANALAPDGLVYLTDGWAPRPVVSARMPVLWALCASDVPPDGELPGRRVRLTGRNG
ncbi:hypothetical protein Val02_34720 [Virgisporangium aliadipatigenens]|uniref:Metal-dependent peptidase n=1 Tax=Virgisporangium aliadipatigenens TaxID=741659 RepID=A0A8J4DR11_9ACTN|nr:VWA-like domain-containing protein [Virgisporangium aliadipatigenens]GIJ46586.1 hypothetical protein Val02_34720 [Virgisporangium aliadipatigenens]